MSIYICPECGNDMVWEDRTLGALVCEKCGYGVNKDRYGKSDDDEEYEDIWPYYDEDDDEDSGEEYEQVYNELDRARDED